MSKSLIHFAGIAILLVMNSCRSSDLDDLMVDLSSDEADYADWSDATHGNDVSPDYSVVFNQSEVLRFDIDISSENWSVKPTWLRT